MSNSLDTERFVGPDLGPNCLPRLSADDTGRQKVNMTAQLSVLLLFLFFIGFTVKFLNFRMLENFAEIYLKFKQRGQT